MSYPDQDDMSPSLFQRQVEIELPCSMGGNDESWVDISSQPSSSSLASIDAATVGAGGALPIVRQRKRFSTLSRVTASEPFTCSFQHQDSSIVYSSARTPFISGNDAVTRAGSSQDEYDETESDDDRVMTSSNENIASPVLATDDIEPFFHPSIPAFIPLATATDSDDADDLGTAVKVSSPLRRSFPAFRPRPNAFSHPPRALAPAYRRVSSDSAYPHHQHQHHHHHSSNSRIRPAMTRAASDAAMRASLTTLLSCARALPKHSATATTATPPAAPVPAPASTTGSMKLILVPESELPDDGLMINMPVRKRGSRSSSSVKSSDLASGKRAADAGPTRGSRTAKKNRTSDPANEVLLNPSVLAWVVVAGFVVLVSVVGLSAGYVIGREAGRHENLANAAAAAGLRSPGLAASELAVADSAASCGRDAMLRSGSGLRRFRWAGSVMGVS